MQPLHGCRCGLPNNRAHHAINISTPYSLPPDHKPPKQASRHINGNPASRSSSSTFKAEASRSLALPLATAFTALQLIQGLPAEAALQQQTQTLLQGTVQTQLLQHHQMPVELQALPAPHLHLTASQQLFDHGRPILPSAYNSLSSPATVSGSSISALSSSSDLNNSISRPDGLPAIYNQIQPLPTSFPDLPKLNQPKIYQETLPNGLRVYLLEDKEVPIVRGSLLMPGGQVSSPADKVGLASMAASVQRAGGSRAHPGDVMNERLEDLAASLEASAGQQSTTFDFECMAGDTREVLQLLAELLQQPALPADKLDLVKAQVTNFIQHRDDNAGSVARRELYKLLYGEESIYARTATLSGVASITTADLASHIAAWQRPDSAILGLVGDFDKDGLMTTVKEVLGPWAPAPGQPAKPLAKPHENLQDLPGVAAAAAAGGQQQRQQPEVVYLVDRPGAAQASVYAGEPGISLSDPDTYALDVLASTMNSFGGVLFDQLRTREGLAYSVSASWSSPVDHRGLFVAAADTAQPAKLIQGLSRVLSSVRETPPSAEQLDKAKAGLLNSFVFNFASSYSQLQRTLVYQLLGLPQDFLFRYRDRVESVNPEDVVQAAARHLHPSQQVVVVVGDAAVVGPELQQAGFTVKPLQPTPAD